MTKIYLDLSDDLQLLFEENYFSLEEVLTTVDVDHQITYAPLPYQAEGARTKDLVLTVIAVGASIFTVSFAISRVIETLQRKPHLVEIHTLEEIHDTDGKLIVDTEGTPILKTVKRYEILEPRAENRTSELEFHFDLKNGVVLKIRSEETQIAKRD